VAVLVDEVPVHDAAAGTVEPNPEATKAYDQAYELYRTLYGALKPTFDAVAGEGA